MVKRLVLSLALGLSMLAGCAPEPNDDDAATTISDPMDASDSGSASDPSDAESDMSDTTDATDAADSSETTPIEERRCDTITSSITDAGLSDRVTVRCDESYAFIGGDTYPQHDVMNGITGTNEQIPVPAPGYEAPIPLEPQRATAVTTRDSALGVAINGVPIYDYTAGGDITMDADGNAEYDPRLDTVIIGQLDNCGGHSGRGDDYHYHKEPNCMIALLANKDDNPIIGWAFDGYPIYGSTNPNGTEIAPGTLEPCHGQPDDVFGYRYHTSDTQPYIIKCLRGVVDESILPRVSPFRDGGTPIEVEDLQYTTSAEANGTETRRLAYSYRDTDYYIEYQTRSDTDYCFNIEAEMCASRQGNCAGLIQDECLCRSLPSGESAPQGCTTPGGGSGK